MTCSILSKCAALTVKTMIFFFFYYYFIRQSDCILISRLEGPLLASGSNHFKPSEKNSVGPFDLYTYMLIWYISIYLLYTYKNIYIYILIHICVFCPVFSFSFSFSMELGSAPGFFPMGNSFTCRFLRTDHMTLCSPAVVIGRRAVGLSVFIVRQVLGQLSTQRQLLPLLLPVVRRPRHLLRLRRTIYGLQLGEGGGEVVVKWWWAGGQGLDGKIIKRNETKGRRVVLWKEKNGTQRRERERKGSKGCQMNCLFCLFVRTENLPGNTQAQVTFKKIK